MSGQPRSEPDRPPTRTATERTRHARNRRTSHRDQLHVHEELRRRGQRRRRPGHEDTARRDQRLDQGAEGHRGRLRQDQRLPGAPDGHLRPGRLSGATNPLHQAPLTPTGDSQRSFALTAGDIAVVDAGHPWILRSWPGYAPPNVTRSSGGRTLFDCSGISSCLTLLFSARDCNISTRQISDERTPKEFRRMFTWRATSTTPESRMSSAVLPDERAKLLSNVDGGHTQPRWMR